MTEAFAELHRALYGPCIAPQGWPEQATNRHVVHDDEQDDADPGPGAPKAARAVALVLGGMPAAEVARLLGVSRQRVHQYVSKATGAHPAQT